MRRVQAMMDQNMVFLEQGRTDKMNPKIVQLLGRYDELVNRDGSGESGSDDDGSRSPYLSQRTQPKPSKPSKFEELGRQKAQDDLVTEMRATVEAELVSEVWADDVRALFARIGKAPLKEDDFAKIDFIDRKRFPMTRAGYQAWRQVATKFEDEVAARSDAGTEEVSSVDADRAKALGTRRQPSPNSSGSAAVDAFKAAQLRKEGKMTGKEFLEVMRRSVSPGILR